MILGFNHQVWFSATSGVEEVRLGELSNEQVRSLAKDNIKHCKMRELPWEL